MGKIKMLIVAREKWLMEQWMSRQVGWGRHINHGRQASHFRKGELRMLRRVGWGRCSDPFGQGRHANCGKLANHYEGGLPIQLVEGDMPIVGGKPIISEKASWECWGELAEWGRCVNPANLLIKQGRQAIDLKDFLSFDVWHQNLCRKHAGLYKESIWITKLKIAALKPLIDTMFPSKMGPKVQNSSSLSVSEWICCNTELTAVNVQLVLMTQRRLTFVSFKIGFDR